MACGHASEVSRAPSSSARRIPFLTEADIAFYRPLVADFLGGDLPELFVLTDEADGPIGSIALAGDAIEALFLGPPAHRGHGGGRRLLAHAQALRVGALTVDVNEQNEAARGFYEPLGFAVVRRSPLDGTGRPSSSDAFNCRAQTASWGSFVTSIWLIGAS